MRWVRDAVSPDVPGTVQTYVSCLSIITNSGPHYSQQYSGLKKPYDITCTWNLKYDINELIYETETEPQT